jgi:hypothetical protein
MGESGCHDPFAPDAMRGRSKGYDIGAVLKPPPFALAGIEPT